jgi:glycosyltransferase involved in cell wall biosynthesis
MARRLDATLVHGLHLELPRTGVPGVVTIQDLIPLEHPASMPSPARRAVYRRILDSSLRRAVRVIVPSEATAASLRARGVDPALLAVVPLCADPVFRPSSEEERMAARKRFAEGRPYVAAVTGAKAHKNPDGLAAAAALLCGRIDVVAIGGSLTDAELRGFYGGAEILVLPSHVEGFGLPALEALACGVPVVCGAGVGALPYLRDGIMEVDVRSPEEIAGAVARVVEDKALRTRLAEGGTAAASRLSRERMARETVAVYRSVLAQAESEKR